MFKRACQSSFGNFLSWGFCHSKICADDVDIFFRADSRELLLLKGLLRSFADSTGQQINFNKVLPNLTENKAQHLANTFGCSPSPT
jgi:hypothetical protein